MISLLGCAKIKTPEAVREREAWITSFTDSVAYYKDLSSKIENRLDEINKNINVSLENFELVKKAREVTGYYLLKGWQNKIPFTTTGIYARINENEKIELIATMAGGTFNRVGVGESSVEYYSEIVPHDQAFNYRHGTYNTVYFSGGKADTIAQYIASHSLDKIKLEFIEGSKKREFIIPQDEKNMISQTWNLYNSQMEAHTLQKELWLTARKIDTFRRLMDEDNKLEK